MKRHLRVSACVWFTTVYNDAFAPLWEYYYMCSFLPCILMIGLAMQGLWPVECECMLPTPCLVRDFTSYGCSIQSLMFLCHLP